MTSPRLSIIAAAPQEQGAACGSGDGSTVVDPGARKGPLANQFAGNVALVTLGCAKNQVDSEIMLGALEQRGFRPVADPALADLIVVNTCAFLQSAVEEGIDVILGLAQHKEHGRCRELVVAGCMVERYRHDLETSLPEVDRFVSTDELLSIADGVGTSSDCFAAARRPYFLYDEAMPRTLGGGIHSAYIKIAEGCDRPCAFCIIPKLRGNFRSRPIASIAREAESLLVRGARELVLVAQDLTNYGADREGSETLPQLLSELSRHKDLSHEYWVRLLYAYPIGVNEALLRTIGESPVICNYLDLPLQHISNPVLKSMRRPLGERRTRELIEMIRRTNPEIALRTTFITGFPGETDADVEALRAFIEEGHFLHVGIFTYSQEEEALSFGFESQVPPAIREERRKWLMEAQQRVLARRLNEFVGKQLKVLVDGEHPESELLLSGRTEFQAPETDGMVIINELDDEILNSLTPSGEETPDLAKLTGSFGQVEITGTAGYDLLGRLVAVES